jgi:hypothetical protein
MRKVLATLAVALLGVLAFAAPAQAHRPAHCPNIDGYLCWSDNAATHAAAHVYIVNTHGILNQTCYNIGVASGGMNWNNAIRSMYFNDFNQTHYAAHYSGSNCSGVVVVQVQGFFENERERSCNESANFWNGTCNPPTISSFQRYQVSGLNNWTWGQNPPAPPTPLDYQTLS